LNRPKDKPLNRRARRRSAERGQSLVELALVVSLLMFMLAGIVEYGFLLNRYLNLVDATREAARLGANVDPFERNEDGTIMLDEGNPVVDMQFFVRPFLELDPNSDSSSPDFNPPGLADFVEDFLEPLELDPERDDVVISFFSVNSDLTMTRFPLGDTDGWSYFDNSQSQFSNAEVASRMSSDAPPSGVLLIEVYYNYDQALNLPLFNIVNPIPVYAYAIMPLSAAEPESP
jgi:hypothetical protein